MAAARRARWHPSPERSRLELEINLHRLKIDDEVVLLEAENESGLRRTHRRYFESLAQIVHRITVL